MLLKTHTMQTIKYDTSSLKTVDDSMKFNPKNFDYKKNNENLVPQHDSLTLGQKTTVSSQMFL